MIMPKTKIPLPILLEIKRLLNRLQQEGIPEEEAQLSDTQEPSDPIAETLEVIESTRRRARKLLSKYNRCPTPARARRVAKLMFQANTLFLVYLIDVGRGRRSGRYSVPSKWFPFPIPGLF
jgi:hypothetical protein